MKIKLLTPLRDLIQEFTIPAFAEVPGIVLWGARAFQRVDSIVAEPYEYEEAFVYRVN